MNDFSAIDLGVLLLYLLGVTAWGAWLGRGQRGGSDYFLGNRELPWGAVMLSVVATETSTLTFLSIPGVAYLGTLHFLQLTFGYLAGRILVSFLLLPHYYAGKLTTAYALLGERFGTAARRFTSGVFMVTRLLADSVRLFATAIPLALITGWSYPVSIAVIGVLTVIYTYVGGIRAVVWVDVLQMGLYLLGGIVAIGFLHFLVDGGWGAILADGQLAGKLAAFDFSPDPKITYTFWAGLVGGGVLSMASHGTDQLIVQRLLACKDLRSSQKALIGSGVAVIFQFLLFLLVGIGLWQFYGGQSFERGDEIFARFIVQELPPGVTGLLIAGIFAAAMSSLSSSINSLASASAYDFWAPLRKAEDDEAAILRAGKAFTLLWALLLVVGACVFIPLGRGSTAVEAALAIASLVGGGLLGVFALGVVSPRTGQRGAIAGMAAGILAVISIRLFYFDQVAWTWYAIIGAATTYAVGALAGLTAPAIPEEESE